MKIIDVDVRELTQPDRGAAPPLGKSRSRLLEALEDAGKPLAANDVAELVGLHPNTARFHLDALVETGLAHRNAEERERPGRPRVLYTATAGGTSAGRSSYRLLAEILTSYMASQIPKPAEEAQRAGQAWGRYLADRPPPFRRTDAATAIGKLARTLDEIGFAPEVVDAGREHRILLRHCPFRETAAQHREVVCSVHLGLMQGLLTELDAPVESDRLEPFVEPNLCVTHLTRRNQTESAKPPGRG